MPYKTVKEARDSIPSLKNLDTKEVRKFIKVFNSLVEDNMSESKAIPLAISQAKKIEKSTTITTDEEKINTLSELIAKGASQYTEQMLQLLSEIKNNTCVPESLQKSTENTNTPTPEVIMKSVNEEERLALFVALPIKDEDSGEYDLHNDSYSASEVRKAMLNYNEHCMKAGVYHLYETQDAVITQSYLAPVDISIEDANGDERVIKSGSWLQEWWFPETDIGETLWNKVKDGELTGISVQCNCVVEDIDE